MFFVNTFIHNIALVYSRVKFDITFGATDVLTTFAIIIFALSLVMALYISFSESQKRKGSSRTASSQIEYKDSDKNKMSSDDTSPSLVNPSSTSDNTLSPSNDTSPRSRLLLSTFETVLLLPEPTPQPAENISEPLPSSPEPILSQPEPAPSRPKPIPSRPPKPIPLPIKIPPSYYITDLQVNPARVNIGDTVLVSFTVTSNATVGDNYEITLKIDDLNIYSEYLFLFPGESKSVSFPLSAVQPGEWDIDVNGIKSKLSILEGNL